MKSLLSLIKGLILTQDAASDQPELLWWRWATLILFPLHLVITHVSMGLRPEHLLMDGVFIGLAWAGPRLRRLSWLCVPFGLTAIEYDFARFWVHLRAEIHVADLYQSELSRFGVTVAGVTQTLPELFNTWNHPALDFICGLAYIAYIYEVILLGFYLYFKDEGRMGRLAWAFFLVNMMGQLTYLIYPAAPPWYVMLYGLGPAVLNAPPSPAGAQRFDDLLGISYFKHFYARSTNVFGAMPSLHVAYPVMVCCTVANKGRLWLVSTGAFALLVAFSAIYLGHHWVWDVIFGALYGAGAYGIVTLASSRWIQHTQGGTLS